MANEQLKEFLRKKKEESGGATIDWDARREDWIRSVGDLYETIATDYLGSADLAGIVEIGRGEKTIQESYLGTYKIPELTLSVGGEQVFFSPKGSLVVGAAGRVDVRGDRGEATLVRDGDDRWSIVISRSPKLQLAQLNDETFLEMLRGIMR